MLSEMAISMLFWCLTRARLRAAGGGALTIAFTSSPPDFTHMSSAFSTQVGDSSKLKLSVWTMYL
jgi:hypothetical protein